MREMTQSQEQRIEIEATETCTFFDDTVHRGEIIAFKMDRLIGPMSSVKLGGGYDC